MVKFKDFKDKCTTYKIMDVLNVTENCDRTASNTTNKWNGTETGKLLLDHLSFFTMEHIADFQCDTINYCKTKSAKSDWIRDFTNKSPKEEICNQVNKTYSNLPTKYHGGFTMVKLMMDVIFFMSNDVVNVL